MKSKRRNPLIALVVVILGGLAWLFVPELDLLFHGKPESVWIKSIVYNGGEEQTKLWRDFGPEGVRVLTRALDRADRRSRWERAYVRAYQRIAPRLPRFLAGWLPAVKSDSTYSTRMCLVDLLSRLGNDAQSATPAMIRALNDGASGVRQIAISFFTWGEDENARLNLMPEKEKRKLLPEFVRLAQDLESGVRNNTALALRYYPEQGEIVAPVLVKALQDPIPQVRMCAAESLNRVAPDLIAKAGVVPVVIGVLKDPDDQIAYRAAQLLGDMRVEPALAVPALIEALENINTLVAATAAQALVKFKESADTIIPALEKAAQRKDNVSGYAKGALKQFESKAPANQEIKQ
jgi:HEAT repeat protein